MKKIPIKTAREIAHKFDYDQIIIWAWNKKCGQHVTTYGKTIEDCDQVAQGGNWFKKFLGWPKNLCCAEPNRVKLLKARIKELEGKI